MNRRSLLIGGAAVGLAGTAAYGYSSSQSVSPQRLSKRPSLTFPEQLDARQSGEFSLTAKRGVTNFLPNIASQTIGFNQPYLGPVVRVAAKGSTKARVSNQLPFPITSHWHGMIIPGIQDGGPHQLVNSGATWSPELTVNQPPAMTWYHSHVAEHTAQQVYAGLAGVMIVDDGNDDDRGLPTDYGKDDLVLVIQDKLINDAGYMAYATSMHDQMTGFVGNTMLVNGQLDPVASVPKSIVRLRFLNASNAGVHQIEFSDGRPLFIVASDSGYLATPIQVKTLRMAPGERFQVLVDFSDGKNPFLVSTPQPAVTGNGMMGMMMRGRSMFSRLFEGKTSVLAFNTDQSLPVKIKKLPTTLGTEGMSTQPTITQTRIFRLETGMGMMGGGMMGGGMMGGGMSINGRSFDMNRVDAAAKIGTFEKWIVRADVLSHPFHIHGVKFRVLLENGRKPRIENQGWKDTTLVKDETELLIEFTQHATPAKPFMFHCHILEHEDAGMMGQFSVT